MEAGGVRVRRRGGWQRGIVIKKRGGIEMHAATRKWSRWLEE